MHVLRDREEDFVATNNSCLSTWKYSVLSSHETGVEIIKKVCFIVEFSLNRGIIITQGNYF
jgi:hypothetical protein